jgi:hypothetical protein
MAGRWVDFWGQGERRLEEGSDLAQRGGVQQQSKTPPKPGHCTAQRMQDRCLVCC